MVNLSKPTDSLASAVCAGHRAAIGKALSLVEGDSVAASRFCQEITGYTGQATVIGLTGPAGCGKSTLINAAIAHLRRQGLQVAVAAVDRVGSVSSVDDVASGRAQQNVVVNAAVYSDSLRDITDLRRVSVDRRIDVDKQIVRNHRLMTGEIPYRIDRIGPFGIVDKDVVVYQQAARLRRPYRAVIDQFCVSRGGAVDQSVSDDYAHAGVRQVDQVTCRSAGIVESRVGNRCVQCAALDVGNIETLVEIAIVD